MCCIVTGFIKTIKLSGMKPLNSKERAEAFYKVIGLFVVCFVLAILLGFATMKEKNVGDYTARKQLEALKNKLMFQEKVFQPNIESATEKLQDLPNYKEKNLTFDDIATSVNVSLENIKKEWKVDEKDPEYLMYKNVVDIYFTLKSTYSNKFKLEENIGDLQRGSARKDELELENRTLKSDKDNLSSSVTSLQSQTSKLQSQLLKCRDSLRTCLDVNKGYKQQLNKPK
jgi:hypothetical protein